MSDDNKSGSELDIFEGLGKKSSTTRSSVAPPPPPGGASSEARVSAAPPAPPQPVEVKKTLLGIAAPLSPQTSVAPAARPSRPPLPPSSSTITAARPSQPGPPRPSQNPDAPPPPPKRASLPNLQAATPIKTPTATTQDAVATEPLAAGAKLDMDWDDDNEATHVYDKDKADKPEESTLDDSKELETAPVLGPGVGDVADGQGHGRSCARAS